MREPIASGIYVLLFQLAVCEGSQILCTFVPDPVYRQDLLIAVRDDHWGEYDHEKHQANDYDASYSKRVLEELAHSILEERSALAHDIRLALLFVACLLEHGGVELGKVYLDAERHLGGHVSNLYVVKFLLLF